MKLKLRLVTSKAIPIDLDFRKLNNATVSIMSAIEYSEQIVEFDLGYYSFLGSSVDYTKQVIKAIKEVIKKQYPNITSIEGLEELKLLKE